jgi:hypothetical protein
MTTMRDKAMLVSLSISKPQLSKKDKETTTEVALDKSASESAVAVVKKLYPKHLLQPIQEVESSARRYVESVTQPWARGTALLPSRLFMDFQQQIGTFRLQFTQAVTVFLNNYAGVMSEAALQQGTMFDSSIYPDLSTLKSDFSFDVSYIPMGEVPSVMDGIEASVLADVRTEVEAQTKQALANGQRALYQRLGAAVQRIATQCGNEKGKIYESLTGNLEEMLKVLPALNLADDPDFTRLCDEAKVLIVNPVAIKTVPGVRESMAEKADEILSKMAVYL